MVAVLFEFEFEFEFEFIVVGLILTERICVSYSTLSSASLLFSRDFFVYLDSIAKPEKHESKTIPICFALVSLEYMTKELILRADLS